MKRPDEEDLAELRPSAREEAGDWEIDREGESEASDDEVVS